jgi:hypothetical protein
MKKYLVAYTFGTFRGTGSGRTFGTVNGPVNEETILGWEKAIRETNGFDSVAIYNFVPIAS